MLQPGPGPAPAPFRVIKRGRGTRLTEANPTPQPTVADSTGAQGFSSLIRRSERRVRRGATGRTRLAAGLGRSLGGGLLGDRLAGSLLGSRCRLARLRSGLARGLGRLGGLVGLALLAGCL